MTVHPGRYDTTIAHHRREPLDYQLGFRLQTWLVDLDQLPRLPRGLDRVCRFDPRDHLDPRRVALRIKVDQLLHARGAPGPSRVLMLAQPRLLGYVFNPLSVFYCLDQDDGLRHVLAEVRNTYGGRHVYLLTPDGTGRSHAAKAFYVSPFHPVDGSYELHTPAPQDRLVVQVTLHRPGAAPFTAAVTGRRCAGASLWPALRHPLATRAVMAAIRRHGIALFCKGLRPVPRTVDRKPSQCPDRTRRAQLRRRSGWPAGT